MDSSVVFGAEGWLGRSMAAMPGFRSSGARLGHADADMPDDLGISDASALVICETLSPTRAMAADYRTLYLARLRRLLNGGSARVVIFISSAITTRAADGLAADRLAYREHKLDCERLINECAAAAPATRFFILRPTAILGAGCHSNFLCEAKRRLLAGDAVALSNPAKRVNGFVSRTALCRFVAGLAALREMTSGLQALTLAAGDSISIREIAELMVRSGFARVTCPDSDMPVDNDLHDVSEAVALGFEAGACRSLIQSFLGER